MTINSLVSVIIPVYNVKPYLDEAIKSVLCQTYSNLEIIIIDDGSTDGSEVICDKYAREDKRIIVIHQGNKGLSAARNSGLEIMTGEVVSFLDSDDAYCHEFIEEMMSAMIFEETDIVMCKHLVNNSDGLLVYNDSEKGIPAIDEGLYNRDNALRSLADGKINPGIWNKIYKRKLWDCIRFPEGHVYEEVDTTYRLIGSCNSLYVIDKALYLYRRRVGSITLTYNEKNIQDWLLAHSHFESFIANNIPSIFSIDQLKRTRQLRFRKMIVFYARLTWEKGREENKLREYLRQQITSIGNEFEKGSFDLATRIGYFLICKSPFLFKTIYLAYISIRYINN